MTFWHFLRAGIGFGTGFLCVIGSALFAVTVTGMNSFAPGDLISSAQINQNFQSLKTAIESVRETPAGAVMPFFRDACPDGWTAADGSIMEDYGDGLRTIPDLRNRFVRGVGGSVVLGTFYHGSSIYTWNQTQCHDAIGCAGGATLYVHRMALNVNNTDSGTSTWTSTLTDSGTLDSTSGKVRPDNVGLLFCLKDP